MKIAVLGNSHVAALKAAWDKCAADFADRDLVFFADGGDEAANLSLVGNKLVPNTEKLKSAFFARSGGYNEIDCSEFDCLLIYGLGLRSYFVRPNQFYSSSATRSAICELNYPFLSLGLVELVRKISQCDVYFGHAPLIAAARYESDPRRVEGYIQGLKLTQDVIFGPDGPKLVGQPFDTIENGHNTALNFSQGSPRLWGKHGTKDLDQHGSGDTVHMNSEFGRLWLKLFFEQIE